MANSDPTEIILVGAGGRMGKTITNLIAADPGFKLAGAVEKEDRLAGLGAVDYPVSDNLEDILKKAAGVIVDFSQPDNAMRSAAAAAACGRPIVIGTTGLSNAQRDELSKLARECPMLCSSNMSIGINVLMRILPRLAKALGPEYDMEIVEIHHNRKKDAPSGTAIMLGEELAGARGWELAGCGEFCRQGIVGERPKRQIGIQAVRGGDVAGVHTVYFFGPGERIEVTHQAHTRENFANGALTAANWLENQKAGRIFSMQDIFGGEDA